MQKKTTHWGFIIFWFFLIPVIGVILFVNKLKKDKAAVFSGIIYAKIAIGISIFWAVIHILMLIGNISISYEYTSYPIILDIIFAVMYIVVAIWARGVIKNLQATGIRYKQYINLIINQGQTSLDAIASSVGVSYEIVVNDINSMITAGNFANAKLNATSRTIVLNQQNIAATKQTKQIKQEVIVSEKIVVCKNCGANNRLVTSVAQCEYCASPIS
jgi:hypothetical protein